METLAALTRTDLLALAVPVLLVLLVAYVFNQARRSREAELNDRLRKSQIALQDAEHALENTIRYYKAEIVRLKTRLGESSADAVAGDDLLHSRRGNGVTDKAGPETGEAKFRQAKNAFARLYHPDRFAGDGIEKRIRTELFKEFWNELERIERRNP